MDDIQEKSGESVFKYMISVENATSPSQGPKVTVFTGKQRRLYGSDFPRWTFSLISEAG